jgi:hypothetical protein
MAKTLVILRNIIFKNSGCLNFIVLLVFGFFINYSFAFSFDVFGFPDGGLIFDLGWKFLSGQIPFEDFSPWQGITAGYLEAISFALFGVNLNASVIHASVMNGLAAGLSYILLTQLNLSRLAAFVVGVMTAVLYYPPQKLPYSTQDGILFVLVALVLAVFIDKRNSSLKEYIIAWTLIGLSLALAFLGKQTVAFLFPAFFAFCLINFRKTFLIKGFFSLFGSTLPFLAMALASTDFKSSLIRMGFYIFEMPLTYVRGNRVEPSLISQLYKFMSDLHFMQISPSILLALALGCVGLVVSVWNFVKGKKINGIHENGARFPFAIISSILTVCLILGTFAQSSIAYWPKWQLLQLVFVCMGLGMASIYSLFIAQQENTSAALKGMGLFTAAVLMVGIFDAIKIQLNANWKGGFITSKQMKDAPVYTTGLRYKQINDAVFYQSRSMGPYKWTNKDEASVLNSLLKSRVYKDALQKVDANFLLVGLPKYLYGFLGRPSPLPVNAIDPGAASPPKNSPEFKYFIQKIDSNFKKFNIQLVALTYALYVEKKDYIASRPDVFCSVQGIEYRGQNVIMLVDLCPNLIKAGGAIAHIIGADRRLTSDIYRENRSF